MPKYLVSCKVPYLVLDKFQQALEDICESIMVFEDEASMPSEYKDDNGFPIASIFQVDMLCNDKDVEIAKMHAESAAALLGIEVEIIVKQIENTNWLLECYQGQPEIRIHPFVIHSSVAKTVAKTGEISLKIDAATAFGSGEHPTTKGCLKLFTRLAKKHTFKDILDMGCGSGILSIAAKKLQPTVNVVAADIEMEAVRRTRLNSRINACEKNYQVFCSVGFQSPKTHKVYDLCFANILAKPLMRLAPYMKKYIKDKGYIIVSGLLENQAQQVIKAYQINDFIVCSAINIQKWQTIILQKKSRLVKSL